MTDIAAIRALVVAPRDAALDPARALERYRQVVDEPRTPPAVRLGGA